MTYMKKALVALALIAFMGVGFLTPFAAKASEAGRKNTTLALGALTGVLALKKMWIPAAIAGVGTYYAEHNWQAEINARHRRENELRYLHAYRAAHSRSRR